MDIVDKWLHTAAAIQLNGDVGFAVLQARDRRDRDLRGRNAEQACNVILQRRRELLLQLGRVVAAGCRQVRVQQAGLGTHAL